MTTIEICDRKCGANWHRFCAKRECENFYIMLIESEKTKMFFGEIGEKGEKPK